MDKEIKKTSTFKDELLKYFSDDIRNSIDKIDNIYLNKIEEIRFRINRPIMIYNEFGGEYLLKNGKISKVLIKDECIYLSKENMRRIMQSLTKHSMYAYQDDLKNGFITLENGYRCGIAGSADYEDGKIKIIKDITSINLRIPRALKGVGERVIGYIKNKNIILNTLIVSPPQQGKTTLIRDLARLLGDNKIKVCIIDERSEIASLTKISSFDVGIETDVIDGIRKSDGILMALRSLSPNVIITDEIGRESDLISIREIINCGVNIIATAHASSINELEKRLFFKKLILDKAFDTIVFLSTYLGRGTVQQIYDSEKRELLEKPFLMKGKIND